MLEVMLRVSLCVACLGFSSTLFAQSEFYGLGDLPGGTVRSDAWWVSADGSVVVGGSSSSPPPYPGGPYLDEAFRWTMQGGMEPLGRLSGPDGQSTARGVSWNGSIIVGDDVGIGFRWADGAGLVALNPASGDGACYVRGVSENGQLSFGQTAQAGPAGTQACYWSGSSTATRIGDLQGGNIQAEALDASFDGSVIVGYGSSSQGQYEAFRWTAQDGMIGLGDLPGGSFESIARGVSGDGAIVVGRGYQSGWMAFRWSEAEGMAPLGLLPGCQQSDAFATSSDGTVIVGSCDGADAFIWTAEDGMRSIRDILISDGVTEVAAWTLWEATSVSADGTVVCGTGWHDGHREGWVARLCPDIDRDGLCNGWEMQGGGIDVNGDGVSEFTPWDAGARPNHKDLFLEIDYMDGLRPSDAAIDMVKLAFESAPNAYLGNPDGLDGIGLHYAIDTTPIARFAYLDDPPNTEFLLDKRNNFGSPADTPEIRSAKAKVFRYCIFGYEYGGTSKAGIAEIRGDDLLVTLGHPEWPVYGGSVEEQAGTLMHELGHTLGLLHGGHDDINYKPNYHSVMNYTWQVPLRLTGVGLLPEGYSAFRASWELDFSREPGQTLDEHSLDEQLGVGLPALHCGHSVLIGPPAPLVGRVVSECGNVDFDGNGTVGAHAVAVDISRPLYRADASLDELVASSDWSRIDLMRTGSHYWPDVVDLNALGGEIDAELHRLISNPKLQADLDEDGDVDLRDYSLLQICAGGTSDPCWTQDINRDAAVDWGDMAFLTSVVFGP